VKRPPPPPKPIVTDEMRFSKWIVPLSEYGWVVRQQMETKIGRQIRFRKLGYSFEIRVTQRRNSDEFEAEHIMKPDADKYGRDWSYMSYFTISLKELLRHIGYTK
jgi:hypothetical protein